MSSGIYFLDIWHGINFYHKMYRMDTHFADTEVLRDFTIKYDTLELDY
jgi:hypothetical protein